MSLEIKNNRPVRVHITTSIGLGNIDNVVNKIAELYDVIVEQHAFATGYDGIVRVGETILYSDLLQIFDLLRPFNSKTLYIKFANGYQYEWASGTINSLPNSLVTEILFQIN